MSVARTVLYAELTKVWYSIENKQLCFSVKEPNKLLWFPAEFDWALDYIADNSSLPGKILKWEYNPYTNRLWGTPTTGPSCSLL